MDDKLNNINNEIDSIKILLLSLTKHIEHTRVIVDVIETEIKKINNKLDGDLLNECKKMGSHIDFIETVYDNIKHPLSYICKQVDYFSKSDSHYISNRE